MNFQAGQVKIKKHDVKGKIYWIISSHACAYNIYGFKLDVLLNLKRPGQGLMRVNPPD